MTLLTPDVTRLAISERDLCCGSSVHGNSTDHVHSVRELISVGTSVLECVNAYVWKVGFEGKRLSLDRVKTH